MITQNIPLTPREVKAETLLAEIREFIRLAMTQGISIKEAGGMLLKIENWENSK